MGRLSWAMRAVVGVVAVVAVLVAVCQGGRRHTVFSPTVDKVEYDCSGAGRTQTCAAARCKGHGGGSDSMYGGLNCPDAMKQCPDDLSKIQFASVTEAEQWDCKTFKGEGAQQGTVKCGRFKDGSKICTKGGVIHPNKSGRRIGAFILNRTVCPKTGSKDNCQTYKTSWCVKADKDFFDSSGHPTDQQLEAFATHVSDKWGHIYDKKKEAIRDGWSCTGDDVEIAADAVMMY